MLSGLVGGSSRATSDVAEAQNEGEGGVVALTAQSRRVLNVNEQCRPQGLTVGHRTGTHSAVAVAAIVGLGYFIVPAWWALLAGCYASHIALDLIIGRQGVQLLWPAPAWLTIVVMT